ncbi:RagB/SusD family nutrient uptake outer membrane protein [Adhaeribacter swui]|uniref:RagB/SusD family nutrient uptake outer membrane protein n=1 Tax=Adhaeribacter swui TaxID=2086471 RepID=A0A7G7G545_9BACT|nr:RagB/SusD family nutrient uptake outer membrane protein [Adhaeribacter swui]QNF32279.1 RagB/SusD family nutrient uptake outer membrane protein [Adhaeribacter swui]
MKYLLYITLFFALVSCESYIDLKPLAENSVDNFYNTASDMEQAVIATYDGLQTSMRPGYLDHFAEVRSDNTYDFATTPAGGAYADFDNFNLTSANDRLNVFWHNSYLTIQRANIVLNRIDAITMDETIKAQRKGEVKFIRALTYFYLAQIWGDVPLVVEETTDPISFINQTRTPVAEIYNQILKDLTEAVDVLPVTVDNANDGRVTQGAALGLLARVNLVRKDYSKVIEYTDRVINLGVYSLDANYAGIFNYATKSNEVIFKVVFKSGTNSEGYPYLNVNHDYNNTASRDFMETYKDDPRLDAIVDTTNIKTYNSPKVHNENVNTDNTIDIKTTVIRYSDILLMKAEALNELQYPSQEALDLLNQVHTRAQPNPAFDMASFTSKDAFLNGVLNERRIEFAFENLRWFDLVRTGKALEVMSAKNTGGDKPNSASALPFTISERDLLFPVPQVQIDASSGNLTQNPGY